MRYAHSFDVLPSGELHVAADHQRLAPDVAQQLVGYLRGATAVMRTTASKPDEVDPESGLAFGQSMYFDGEWYWLESLADYVERYGLAPQVAFVEHCRDAEFAARQPTESEVAALRTELGVTS